MKIFSSILLGVGISFISITTAFAGEWKQDKIGWWYDNGNGTYPNSGWEWIDGNKDSYAECYYFGKNGYMFSNTYVEGFKLNADGAWVDSSGNVQRKQVSHEKDNNSDNNSDSKKGLAVTELSNHHGKELRVKHIIWNNPVNLDYSEQFQKSKDDGFTNTVIILNPWQTTNPLLLPVTNKQEGAVFYGFNTSTEESKKAVREVARKFARNYSKSVSNWIIGNEINEGNTWNFLPNREINAYTTQYAESFRIWYEEIKAANPNANVYIPFDYRWNWYSDQGYGAFQASQMIPILNQTLKDTYYGIAWHAYPEDLVDPDFTNDISAKDSVSPPIINMKNINALTNFMQQQDYLSPNGTVRSVILSEQGFNATTDEKQAQMIETAYNIAKENPYIDIFFLSRENDLGEMHLGQEMKFGIIDRNGNKRASFETYKNLK